MTQEECVITRMRIGHSGLNDSLFRIGKHPTAKCEECEETETVEHVLLHCRKYSDQRNQLHQSLKKVKHNDITMSTMTTR